MIRNSVLRSIKFVAYRILESVDGRLRFFRPRVSVMSIFSNLDTIFPEVWNHRICLSIERKLETLLRSPGLGVKAF